MTHPKHPGECYCCGVQCYEPSDKTKQWSGHRATVMLANNTQMAITLCDACLEEPDLNKIWRRAINAWVHEIETKVRLKPEDIAAKEPQLRLVAKYGRENFILGILYSNRCCDILDWV